MQFHFLKKIFSSNHKSKVEIFLKSSLDSIPSPSSSVKIQIMGWKFCLRCKGKTLVGDAKKLLLSEVNFPGNNLNFH